VRRLQWIALLAAGVAGCGGGGEPTKADTDDAVRTVENYFAALSIRNFESVCEKVTEDERGPGCPSRANTAFADAPDEMLADLADADVSLAGVEDSTIKVRVRSTGEFSEGPREAVVPLEKQGGDWRVSDLPNFGRPDEVMNCIVQLIGLYEAGDTDDFWRKEGRADFVEYSRRVCKELIRRNVDLDSPKAVAPVSGQVILEMAEEGRIKSP